VHCLRFAGNTCPRSWSDNWPVGQPFCSPTIHTRHSCASSPNLCGDVGVFTHASMQVPPLSLYAPAADGGAFMYLYWSTVRLIHIRGARALTLSLYIHRPSTDIARQRTKTIGHCYSLLGYSDLVFPDSGWFRNPVIPDSGGSEYWEIRRIRMLPDSKLTAGSGFRTRIRHTPN